MSTDKIVIKGAREHNLKNVDVTIPRDKLIVMTGLSGSGKSSLAFDTIYADGQRRYMESLSSYARQFLGQMEKPDVDEIQGLSLIHISIPSPALTLWRCMWAWARPVCVTFSIRRKRLRPVSCRCV